MGLSAALGIARSGLNVTGVQADTLARNISNSSTKGYVRKAAELATDQNGGVRVSAISRPVDAMLDRLSRGESSRLSGLRTVAEGMKAYTDFLGQPRDGTSPAARLSALNEGMITLASAVGDRSAQSAVVTSAREMAANLNSLAGALDEIRSEVDLNIRYDVADLNRALDEISVINKRLIAEPDGTASMAQLQDRMGILIDTVSGFMDVQVVTGRHGAVSVLTGGGTELVTGNRVHDVTYDPNTGRLAAGEVDITPGGSGRAFTGGTLAGLFALRDDVLPSWSSDLDTMAAALVEGFSREAPLGTGAAGLFTDRADPYDPSRIDGLARRIAVNPEVDPDQGGDPALLHKGTDPARASGDGSVIEAMLRLFDQETAVPGREYGTGSSLLKMTTSIVAAHQGARAAAEAAASTAEASAATISASRENLQGVSVDDELQKLLMVERNYAANAKVLSAVSEMIDSLIQAV